MIYYLIRHKATGEFMPELERTRGYSHWNPSKFNTLENLNSKLLGVPRLFPHRRKAQGSINQWNAMPNANYEFQSGPLGSEDYNIKFRPDGRSKDDLEIVEVAIVEVGIDWGTGESFTSEEK